MTLHPQAAEVLALGARSGRPPFEEGSAEDARRAYREAYLSLRGELEPVAQTREETVEVPGGRFAMRIHRGIGAPESGAPALLYLHGGGWVIGDLDSHDDICRWFANAAGCVVACPDYRLAPEHRFPAAIEDVRSALAHLHADARRLGIDPSRIAVAGDSAGGNLAAVLALLARDGAAPPLQAQLLLYPNTDARQTAESYRRFAEGYGLTARTMRWFRNQYIRGEADVTDWRVSPLLAESLAGAPPAFVAIAGQDILADEGLAYAERLRAEGVPLLLGRFDDQIHGFASAGRYIDAARETVWEAAAPGSISAKEWQLTDGLPQSPSRNGLASVFPQRRALDPITAGSMGQRGDGRGRSHHHDPAPRRGGGRRQRHRAPLLRASSRSRPRRLPGSLFRRAGHHRAQAAPDSLTDGWSAGAKEDGWDVGLRPA